MFGSKTETGPHSSTVASLGLQDFEGAGSDDLHLEVAVGELHAVLTSAKWPVDGDPYGLLLSPSKRSVTFDRFIGAAVCFQKVV